MTSLMRHSNVARDTGCAIVSDRPGMSLFTFVQKATRSFNHYNPRLFSSERLRNITVGCTEFVECGGLITPRDGYGIKHLNLIIGVATACVFRLPFCHGLEV